MSFAHVYYHESNYVKQFTADTRVNKEIRVIMSRTERIVFADTCQADA